MNDRQLCDELKTLMVAGLDTTALAISWALLLLSQNESVAHKLWEELNSVLGNRAASFGDLPKLRYSEAVIKETMRIYPPAWGLGREAREDCEIGGHFIRRGVSIIMSQWVKHRDARHFPEPEAFRPERWLPPLDIPKMAYFPFGGGPRICIGNSFAMLEATLGLATIAQQFRVTSPPSYRVEPWPAITLQPRGGIHLTIKAARRTAVA